MADNEEAAIEYLFYRGYEYREIIGLLSKDFGIEMSLRTLVYWINLNMMENTTLHIYIVGIVDILFN